MKSRTFLRDFNRLKDKWNRNRSTGGKTNTIESKFRRSRKQNAAMRVCACATVDYVRCALQQSQLISTSSRFLIFCYSFVACKHVTHFLLARFLLLYYIILYDWMCAFQFHINYRFSRERDGYVRELNLWCKCVWVCVCFHRVVLLSFFSLILFAPELLKMCHACLFAHTNRSKKHKYQIKFQSINY